MTANSFNKIVSDRILHLSRIIEEKAAAVQKAPEGILRVSGNKTYAQYYFRRSKGDKNGTYMHKSEISHIRALAQKSYDEKVLRSARREIQILQRLQKNAPVCAENLYPALPVHRQKLITPVELSDNEFIQQWKEAPFTPKPFSENAPEHYTRDGMRVRSKSEVIIADTLTDMDIPFLYEKPLPLGAITLHPDFTLLNIHNRKTVYLEHFGMMDDPVYAASAVERVYLYIRHHILPGDRLFMTFETRDCPLNTQILREQFSVFCV